MFSLLKKKPFSGYGDEHAQQVYSELQSTPTDTGRQTHMLFGGDFNAPVGANDEPDATNDEREHNADTSWCWQTRSSKKKSRTPNKMPLNIASTSTTKSPSLKLPSSLSYVLWLDQRLKFRVHSRGGRGGGGVLSDRRCYGQNRLLHVSRRRGSLQLFVFRWSWRVGFRGRGSTWLQVGRSCGSCRSVAPVIWSQHGLLQFDSLACRRRCVELR